MSQLLSYTTTWLAAINCPQIWGVTRTHGLMGRESSGSGSFEMSVDTTADACTMILGYRRVPSCKEGRLGQYLAVSIFQIAPEPIHPLPPMSSEKEQRDYIRDLQSNPDFIIWARTDARHRARPVPSLCIWCKVGGDLTPLVRCKDCRQDLPGCASCTLVAHERHPTHRVEVWTPTMMQNQKLQTKLRRLLHERDTHPAARGQLAVTRIVTKILALQERIVEYQHVQGFWQRTDLTALGFVFQEGHEGLPCPNPAGEAQAHRIISTTGIHEGVARACHCSGTAAEEASEASVE
ncbi:hypothetical protein FB451DRAFT_1170846 [Mycena latifolia]|nr:hypothetical protein FB451DRAFT_1170846 [Mycena latifolia]